MCYNCGCHNPEDDMGSADNITEATLAHLAEHQNKTIRETKLDLYKLLESKDKRLEEDPNISEMFTKAAKAWGQSVEEAKMNTYRLLKEQLEKEGRH